MYLSKTFQGIRALIVINCLSKTLETLMKRKHKNVNRFIVKLLVFLLFLICLNFWSSAAVII